MDISKIKLLSYDEVRALYREFLHSQSITKATINTSYVDTFYLWRKGSKDLFWDTVTSPVFENDAKEALIKVLSENSTGNVNSLVNSYLSHLRRFRLFLASDGTANTSTLKRSNTANRTYRRKKKTEVNVPQPSTEQVELYLAKWNTLDDIVLLAKSKRASERLLESSIRYLEGKLKLTVNREKSRTVSVFAIRNFKFLGLALGRNGNGIFVRVHSKSLKKFKSKLKALSSRRSVQSIKPSLEKIKVYARGWLNYYGIATMKNSIEEINGWLYHRIRMCIWKQWKKPKTKVRNLIKMGVPKELAWQAGNSRRGYWFTTQTVAVNMAMTKKD